MQGYCLTNLFFALQPTDLLYIYIYAILGKYCNIVDLKIYLFDFIQNIVFQKNAVLLVVHVVY